MSFDWREYIKLSEELILRKEEACLRSAVSRSYYGVFCIARNKLRYRSYSGSDVHRKVIETYENSRDIIQKKIGKNLNELRKARNNADYDNSIEIKKDEAERMLVLSKQVLKSMESL
ncbi:MAG: HEPN domain-containing protein [bacterium]|nr:HEPN domain-containing protein [bacterium]